LDPMEKEMPALWHPHAGAAAAYLEWNVRDTSVLQAIRCHTLGHLRMRPLAQVLFVADFIEPGRRFPGIEEARRKSGSNLREGILAKASMTIGYLLQKRLTIHPRLLETWNFFKGIANEKFK